MESEAQAVQTELKHLKGGAGTPRRTHSRQEHAPVFFIVFGIEPAAGSDRSRRF